MHVTHACSRSMIAPIFVLAVLGGPAAPGSAAVAQEGPVFDEAIEDDKCAVLTREDVAAATGIGLDEIEQPYAGFCLYEWDAGPDYPDGNLNITGFTVHESVQRARGDYATFTEDVTAEEIAEGRDVARAELAASGELTPAEVEAAGVLVDAMPEGGFTHRHWAGIGDAASTDGRGTVRVLYGNVTVWITGKTGGEDWIDPDVGRRVARAIVTNLEELR